MPAALLVYADSVSENAQAKAKRLLSDKLPGKPQIYDHIKGECLKKNRGLHLAGLEENKRVITDQPHHVDYIAYIRPIGLPAQQEVDQIITSLLEQHPDATLLEIQMRNKELQPVSHETFRHHDPDIYRYQLRDTAYRHRTRMREIRPSAAEPISR